MSNENWWAAERKAAEFWRKIKENQMRYRERNTLTRDIGATPIARPRASAAHLFPQTRNS